MELIINGDKHQLPDGANVMDVLAQFKLPPVRVAVEVNREIVPKKEFSTRLLSPGDQLEIVIFVGGG